jgi:hypothetical protein
MNTGQIIIPQPQEFVLFEPDAPDRRDSLKVCPKTGQYLWNNMPVPWVSMWSGERASWPLSLIYMPDGFQITFGDPTKSPYGLAAGLRAARDDRGVLWFKEIPDRVGYGVPEFGQISAKRQRACMLERRCQVCSKPFPQGEEVTFLLSTGKTGADWTGEPFTTQIPPTCPPCIDLSMRLCPDMPRRRRSVVYAREFAFTAVKVDVYSSDIQVQTRGVEVDLNDAVLARSVAKQALVTIIDYDEEHK